MAVVSSSSFKEFTIIIKNHYQPTYSCRISILSDDFTVGKLKNEIEKQHKGKPKVEDQLLIYRGKLLKSSIQLYKLFQSSIATNSLTSMVIHMTLRGGSNTANKIGLISNNNNDNDTQKQKQKQKQEEEEEKNNTSSTIPQPQPTQQPTQPQAALLNRQHSLPNYPHNNPYPSYPHYPPPAPHHMLFSQSMPNLYRHLPNNNNNNNSTPSKPFKPPQLIQQTSDNSNNNSTNTSMRNIPPYNPYYYPPYNPYYPPPHLHPYPYPHPQPHPHPHSMIPPPNLHPHPQHPYPHPPPFGHFGAHSYSTSDLRYPYPRPITKAKVSKKIDEKEETNEKIDNDNDNGVRNGNGVDLRPRIIPAPARPVPVPVGADGIRQRRVPNNNNNQNVNQNVNQPAAVNNNNNNVFNNVNRNEQQREGWFARVFRFLNINVLIRLSILMWLFGPNLGSSRFTILCIAVGVYYLHQIGLLNRIFARFWRNRNVENQNEPQHRNPNEEDNSNEPAAPPPTPLTYVQLLQRFLIGIVASLWPTWDPRRLYPVPQ